MSGGREDLMILNPAGPRTRRTELSNNDLCNHRIEWAECTNSLPNRRETPNFEHGTMASQCY